MRVRIWQIGAPGACPLLCWRRHSAEKETPQSRIYKRGRDQHVVVTGSGHIEEFFPRAWHRLPEPLGVMRRNEGVSIAVSDEYSLMLQHGGSADGEHHTWIEACAFGDQP